jgi:transposase InsO family protein
MRVTRSGFYGWQDRPESAHAKRDRQLKVLVQASFAASQGRYGSPRIHEDLLEQQERVSRKRVIRLMQEEQLKARQRKRFKCTTMSDHDLPIADNLLDRQFTAEAPNQRWVGDTTEFVVGESGKLYLAAILDLYSRFIVGWAVSAVNDRHLTIKALEMALKRRGPEAGLRPVIHGAEQRRLRIAERSFRQHVRRCSRRERHSVCGEQYLHAQSVSVADGPLLPSNTELRPSLHGIPLERQCSTQWQCSFRIVSTGVHRQRPRRGAVGAALDRQDRSRHSRVATLGSTMRTRTALR